MSKFSNVSLSEISITESIPGLYFGTLAGFAGSLGSTDGTGSAARFDRPAGVTVDTAGNVYVGDTLNHTIRKVTSSGVVTTLAGLAGTNGSTDGTVTDARFYAPNAVFVNSAGTVVYVADTFNHTIRIITNSAVVTTFAGTAGSSGSTDGTGSAARFSFPQGIVVDAALNIFVADTNNHTIRKITSSAVVSTLAGLAGQSGSTDGTGSAARFSSPRGIALDTAGNIFVADVNNNTIRKITSAGVVTTLAGTAGIGGRGSTDGTGSAARFNAPAFVSLDTSGNIFVTDSSNNTIRKVTSAGVVTTLAGTAGLSGSTDGIGSGARFNGPYGITVSTSGNIFVADRLNHTIRNSDGILTVY
jgi:sugar lactone lactonase YvrE